MRRFRRLAVAIVLVALPSAALADEVDDIVRRQMSVSRLPGVAVAVIERGSPLLVRTYGIANLEWNAPVTPSTRFQLASATKLVTGVLLMRLVEQGRLSLDDPLTRWFPEAGAPWSTIRVRQLADHSSGLADKLEIAGERTVASVVAAAQKAPLAYVPGTETRYGFTDFVVLRAILERAGGRSLPDLVQQEIVRPLNLMATRFADASEAGPQRLEVVLPERAATYALRDDEIVTGGIFFAPTGYGAGGLFSSIGDLATLFGALDRGTLISAASLEELQRPAALSNGQRGEFGVGWVTRTYRGLPVVGHSGGPALADIVRVSGRQLTVIVLTNQQMFHPVLAEAILDLYLPEAVDAPAIPDRAPQVAARVRAILSRQGGADHTALAAPLKTSAGQALLRSVGKVGGIELLSTRTLATCRTERVYRVRFALRPMTWTALVGCRDELLDLRPAP
jgi:CubicO group peptidase (beta-lactamase class C family)